ncbi:hypothetical protein [Halorussus sp. AFM4]|uniref:hypothetical protein n=1 Tax=Halorussus sp. AFM4 TaxID=3421651 RepID=UPI003EBA13B9
MAATPALVLGYTLDMYYWQAVRYVLNYLLIGVIAVVVTDTFLGDNRSATASWQEYVAIVLSMALLAGVLVVQIPSRAHVI